MEKTEIIKNLRESDVVYSVLSLCSRMPYVLCDPETYDDEVFVFFEQEPAMAFVKELTDLKIPAQVIKVEKNGFLPFYSSFYPMGVNAIVVQRGTEDELRIQLPELVIDPSEKELPEGVQHIENRELHLTGLYFVQELRRMPKGSAPTKALQEYQEEILANYAKGSFVLASRSDNKGFVILRNKEGKSFIALFTDVIEFQKFKVRNKNTDEIKPAVVKSADIGKILKPEIIGVIINPMGMNLPLNVKKKEPAAGETVDPVTQTAQDLLNQIQNNNN